MIKLILECDCGNRVVLKPDEAGFIYDMKNELYQHDFYVLEEIEKDGDLDECEDIDDIDVELVGFKVRCMKCDNYIEIDF